MAEDCLWFKPIFSCQHQQSLASPSCLWQTCYKWWHQMKTQPQHLLSWFTLGIA